MKKAASVILALCVFLSALMLPASADAGGMHSFKKVRSYAPGQFSDVQSGDWFGPSVRKTYELGLMNGAGEGVFDPSGSVTVTQAIALAARIHRIYTTGSDDFKQGRLWYDVYARYALEQGIISTRFNCRAPATREKFADILSRALPAKELEAINEVADGAIPDVDMQSEYAPGIYRLYRAGVITGSGSRGRFDGSSGITRAEAAAIVTRMIDPSLRQTVTLTYQGPDLEEGPEKDDSFFSDAAMLGNSLVDGLRLYGSLKTMDFYCGTSVSVVSAMKTADRQLSSGASGTLVQALTEKQYGKIYIELGINEIGYDPVYFAELYGEMIDKIAAAEPQADIYISAIMPVTKSKADSSSVFNNERIKNANAELKKLAQEKGCYFLDLYAAFADEAGCLPSGWSGDGVHLHAEYYAVWESYLRTHYA